MASWPERAPGRLLALIGALFLLAYAASLVWLPKPDGRIVVGDAVQHYVYLRSVVFDGDLQFDNEYARLYGPRTGPEGTGWRFYDRTATGYAPNMMSIGPAIIWSPLYLVTTAGVAAADQLGAGYPLDGYGRLFQASAGFSGILAATVAAWLAFAWARRVFGARPAIWATLTVWLGSSAVYYSVISPTYSHASSMLTASLFFYAWGRTLDRQTPWRYALVGALCGLTALVRWQDAVFLVVPALDVAWHLREGGGTAGRRVARAGGHLLACGLAALAAFLPQMIAWTAIYGGPFLVPQGSAFMRWTSPSLFAVLLSDVHGLISWTPVVALALAGFAWVWRGNRLLGTAVAAVFVLEWYANAAAADWWAGEAFGARRFVSCFPVFVLGLSAVYARLRPRWVPAVAVVFVGLNFLLFVQYQAFIKGLRDLAPYPRGFYAMWIARFVVPFRLAAKLWHALL